MCGPCERFWQPVGCKWAEVSVYYCERDSLSGAGLRPRSPPGILIRGLAAYSHRSRACQSHTLSLTHTHTHTCHFAFSHKHLSLSHTYARREHFSTAHTCAEEACLIAGCGLGSVFSFILILIGLCPWEAILLQWGRTSPYNERDFFLMTSYSPVLLHLKVVFNFLIYFFSL